VIELPRALARDFRAVLRRSLADAVLRGPLPAVLCRAGPGGRSLYAGLGELAVCHHQPGDFPVAELAFPGSVLAAFEGGPSQPVALEEVQPGRGRARWEEGGAVRSAEFPTVRPETVAPFPDRPELLTPVPDGFLAALGEAALTTAEPGSTRLSLSRVQLRGRGGAVVATDGRQLLVQSGFPLPWTDDLLVPRVPAFAGRLLSGATPVAVGRTETHVLVQAGPWTFALAIDVKARYPDVRDVIPRPNARTTHLRLDPADAALLLKALPGLPGHDEHNRPVTLDLGPRPAVRAESGAAVEEIDLSRSAVQGPPLRLATDRRCLLRALRLGFLEVEAGPEERPLVCRDAGRTYLWMYLTAGEALPPTPAGPAAVPCDASPATPEHVSNPTRRIQTMPRPAQNGNAPHDDVPAAPNGARAVEADLETLLAEGEALRGLLQEAHGRLGRLLAGLKHHRRQAKAVETALASLRPFQKVAGGSS
jgi:hypothetical protein